MWVNQGKRDRTGQLSCWGSPVIDEALKASAKIMPLGKSIEVIRAFPDKEILLVLKGEHLGITGLNPVKLCGHCAANNQHKRRTV